MATRPLRCLLDEPTADAEAKAAVQPLNTNTTKPFCIPMKTTNAQNQTGLEPAGTIAYNMQNGKLQPSTIYWMNMLQGVSDKKNYFVSINPHEGIDPKKILKELDYEHPLFDVPAIQAQDELYKLNQSGPIYFCGSYFKYGFHEDAFASAVKLCSGLLGREIYRDWVAEEPEDKEY